MALELTPENVTAITESTVTQAAIDDAATLIHEDTGFTVDEHAADASDPGDQDVGRSIPEAAVKRAWSMVAVRLHAQTKLAGSEAVNTESQGDYSYGTDEHRRAIAEDDLLAGLPRKLLRMPSASFLHATPGSPFLTSPATTSARSLG